MLTMLKKETHPNCSVELMETGWFPWEDVSVVLGMRRLMVHVLHVVQASTRHMLETLNVQSALRIVSAMEKHLLSAAVRKASSGLRKILQLWLVHALHLDHEI